MRTRKLCLNVFWILGMLTYLCLYSAVIDFFDNSLLNNLTMFILGGKSFVNLAAYFLLMSLFLQAIHLVLNLKNP